MDRSTEWDPDDYARAARFVSALGEALLQWLDPRPGEAILDLGCGDGALTEKIAASGCAVYAVDASPLQSKAARARGLRVAVMDGHRLGFKSAFDAVFSNAALHWMQRANRVIGGVAAALKPGGRFVGEFGGRGNVERIRAALHAALERRGIDPWAVDPWYYPSAEEYADLLGSFGFHIVAIDLIPRPTRLPGDLREWLAVFAQPFFKALAEPERDRYLSEVRESLKDALQDSQGRWCADYVRLRFKATKKSGI